MKFYRYETGNVDILNVNFSGTPLLNASLKLIEFVAVRETPKGYWISNKITTGLHLKPKWVSKTGKKRYAYPTKKEALESRIAINKRRIKFLKIDLEITKQVLFEAKKELEKQT